MIIAVTGGTGFIGRRLVARHRAMGDEVRYLTRKTPPAGAAGAGAIVGDLTSPAAQLRTFADGADVLYHCAAELRNEPQMHDTNVVGTANLLAAAQGRVGRWVQLSSTGVYGHGRRTSAEVLEDTPVQPANTYEISKEAADRLVCDAAVAQHMSCVIVRPTNVYGPDMPNQSLFQLIRVIDRGQFFFIGRSKAIANYVHVENVLDALIRCATSDLPGNARTYIVSDYRELRDFVGIMAAALGRPPPRATLPESLARMAAAIGTIVPRFPLSASRVDALTDTTVYRSQRIEMELGFENRISMEEGIGELVHHWRRGLHGG